MLLGVSWPSLHAKHLSRSIPGIVQGVAMKVSTSPALGPADKGPGALGVLGLFPDVRATGCQGGQEVVALKASQQLLQKRALLAPPPADKASGGK